MAISTYPSTLHFESLPYIFINKHFPKAKMLNKIFNRNTKKSVTAVYLIINRQSPVMIIINCLLQQHRMKESTQDRKLCNSRQKNSCPLDGKYLTKCVAYKTTVKETTSNKQETIIALTENEIKTRFNPHWLFIKLEHKGTSPTLRDHVWK